MFVYQADTYCDQCGEGIARDLFSRGAEDSGDSDEFPQSALEEETDSPDHCACGDQCWNRIDLRSYGLAADAQFYGTETRYIGAPTNSGLTDEGVTYLREMLRESPRTPYQRALHALWRELYSDDLGRDGDDDDDDDDPRPTFEEAGRQAERDGEEAGDAAGSWVIDGNTSLETARHILRGIEDGDPVVLDMQPSPLSGEFAGDPLPADVLRGYGRDEDDPEADEILTRFEEGFGRGYWQRVESDARAIAGDDEPPTVRELALEADQWFETATRDDDDHSRYVRLRDGAPEWVQELVRDAHGDFLPDDWRYQCIAAAIDYLCETDDPDSAEFSDSAVDIYSAALTDWLSSNGRRASYCDEALDEFGADVLQGEGIYRLLSLGQYLEAGEVFSLVEAALEEEQGSRS